MRHITSASPLLTATAQSTWIAVRKCRLHDNNVNPNTSTTSTCLLCVAICFVLGNFTVVAFKYAWPSSGVAGPFIRTPFSLLDIGRRRVMESETGGRMLVQIQLPAFPIILARLHLLSIPTTINFVSQVVFMKKFAHWFSNTPSKTHLEHEVILANV